jgi:hypothetical protein
MGVGWGMDEVVLLGISVNLLVLALIIEKYRSSKKTEDRFDDITEGLGVLAGELLSRTEELLKLRDFMPEISLVNQNPLASLAEFIKALKGDMISGENITNPRGSDGRYAAPSEIENTPEIETIDVRD